MSLIKNTHLAKKPNQLVILAGGSAGSFGASLNFNSVGDYLESLGTGIKTVGFFDSSAGFSNETQLTGDYNWTIPVSGAY